MKKERIFYLDLLKFLAIFLVCTYHFAWISNVSWNVNINFTIIINRAIHNICSICIPIFFMVNGALLLNKNLDIEKHYKSLLKLLIQYYIWRLITIIILMIINKTTDISFLNFLNNWILLNPVKGIDLSHFWFIPVLFGIQLIFPFIKTFIDNMDKQNFKYIIFFLIILLITIFLPNDLNILKHLITKLNDINLSQIQQFSPIIGLIGVMLFYFIMGGLLQKYKNKIKINNLLLIIVSATGLLILLLEWYIQSKVSNSNFDSIFRGYQMFSTMLIAIPIFILISKINDKKIPVKIQKFVSLIGDNTLVIYYCHWIFCYVVINKINNLFSNYYSIPLNIIKSLIIVTLFAIAGKILKKFPIIKYLFK